MRTYTTISGDTWDGIAHQILARESLSTILMSMNPQYIQTVIFSEGVTLQLPDEDEIIEPLSDDLPPWKRGEEE